MSRTKQMKKMIEKEKILRGLRETQKKHLDKAVNKALVKLAREQIPFWWIRPLEVHRKVEAFKTLGTAYAGVSKGRIKREANSLARAVRGGGGDWDKRKPERNNGSVSD